MRFVLALSLSGLFGACYQQPAIPKDRPLTCASAAASECPVGFVCVANRVCAPRTCMATPDCPVGLVCSGRGCQFPTDGGGGREAGPGPAPVPGDAGVPDGGSN